MPRPELSSTQIRPQVEPDELEAEPSETVLRFSVYGLVERNSERSKGRDKKREGTAIGTFGWHLQGGATGPAPLLNYISLSVDREQGGGE